MTLKKTLPEHIAQTKVAAYKLTPVGISSPSAQTKTPESAIQRLWKNVRSQRVPLELTETGEVCLGEQLVTFLFVFLIPAYPEVSGQR